MKKSLVLAMVMAMGFSAASFAEVSDIKISGSLTVTGVSTDVDLGANEAGLAGNFIGQNTKLAFDADLTEDVEVKLELQNTRIWGSSDTADTEYETTMRLNRAYVKFNDFMGMPATLKVGRQNFVLGSGLIVRLGQYNTNFTDTNDAQLAWQVVNDSIAADGLRMKLDFEPLEIDLAYIKLTEGAINSRQDDQTYYAVDAKYTINDDANVAAYVIARDGNSGSVSGQTYVYGVRGAAAVNDSIDVFGELAIERATVGNVQAQLFDLGVNYKLNNDKNTKFGLEYMFASGDRDQNDNESNTWNKLSGGLKTGMMGDRFFNNDTNLHVFKLAAGTDVREDIRLDVAYYNFRRARSTDSTDYPRISDLNVDFNGDRNNRELGQSLEFTTVYDYTEDVQIGTKVGFMFPGQYFGSENDNTAYETRLFAKVSF